MHTELEKQIEIMAQVANPTSEQLNNLIAGWDEYFLHVNICTSAKREQEFHSIMSARLKTGVISLVAPSLGK